MYVYIYIYIVLRLLGTALGTFMNRSAILTETSNKEAVATPNTHVYMFTFILAHNDSFLCVVLLLGRLVLRMVHCIMDRNFCFCM